MFFLPSHYVSASITEIEPVGLRVLWQPKWLSSASALRLAGGSILSGVKTNYEKNQ